MQKAELKNLLLLFGFFVVSFTIILESPKVVFAAETEVLPGDGVSFNQVFYPFDAAPQPSSDTGKIDVDVSTLKSVSGMDSGYVNVMTDLGWVVQNLEVSSDFSYPTLSTDFALDTVSGIDVFFLDAFVEYSTDPVTGFSAGSFSEFSVGAVDFNGDCVGAVPDLTKVIGVPLVEPFSFFPLGETFVVRQPNHPNVETAKNQCMPAALANSLQWLENTYGINVPHDNIPGVGGTPTNSLVGQLDVETGRPVDEGTPREDGLRGKLKYILKNGLSDEIVVNHQGVLGGMNIEETLGTDSMTSVGRGTIVTADFILNEIADGEDVEMTFTYIDVEQAHAVDVVGAGKILGVPFVEYVSDHHQGVDGGTSRVDRAYMVDTDGDGSLNLIGGTDNANIDMVISESPRQVTVPRDDDGDGVFTPEDPDDNDPCVPDPNSDACTPPFVAGSLTPIDTTMVLLGATQTTASWMIPVIVAGIGFAIVIARKF